MTDEDDDDMDPATWTTGPDAAAVLAAFTEAVVAQGYTVNPDDTGWAGQAEVGSKAARALAGGFARRMVIGWSVAQGEQEGTTRLTVAPVGTGWSGGALGASKSKKEMANVVQSIHEALAQRSLIVG